MTPKRPTRPTRLSAGLLVHRAGRDGTREVLLVHPGGPFWAKKDDGAWSVPKGEVPQEAPQGEVDGSSDPLAHAELLAHIDPLAHAEREFAEELGQPAPPGPRVPLGEVVQSGGKHVVAWAVEGDVDVDTAQSNQFEMEWPPRSGRMQSFPEVDRAEWFPVDTARRKLITAQVALVDRLLAQLG